MGALIDYLRLTIDYFVSNRYSIVDNASRPGQSQFNCRVSLTQQKDGSSITNGFDVQIAGSIHALCDSCQTALRIFVTDITDKKSKSNQVHSRVQQWQMPNSSAFCYNANIGRLPSQTITLSDWTTAARLNIDWLMFAHKGERKLQFSVSILSQPDGREIACTKCIFLYENPDFGYIDLQENIQRAKILAVALAFAVSAADWKLYDCEVELIRNWAIKAFNADKASKKVRCEVEKALDTTVDFFSEGNQLDIYEICREITEITSVADRYDILDICLHVARVKGFVTAEELAVLKTIADRLKVDADKFRDMMEKTLPVNIHQVKDVEIVLGVTSDMGREKTRQQLNKQFFKWNSRVTNSDPQIRAQADQMLDLIANARSRYIG